MEDLIQNVYTLFDERSPESPAQSSFSSFPSDGSVESRYTPEQISLLSPLLGISSSRTLREAVEATTQERLLVPEVLTTPQSLPDSVLSSTSDHAISSATSLQTRMWSP